VVISIGTDDEMMIVIDGGTGTFLGRSLNPDWDEPKMEEMSQRDSATGRVNLI
jgi:hypothetical protein